MTTLRRHAGPQTPARGRIRTARDISWVPSVTALIPSIMDRTLPFHFPAPLLQAPNWQLAEDAQRIGRELPVSQFPRGAYLPSKYLRINSRLRSLRRILRQSPLRLLCITGDRESCAPSCSREASCPNLNASRPSFHSLQLSAPPVRSARPR